MNSQQLQSKLPVCGLGDASLRFRWPKERSSKGPRRGRRKQKVKQPLAKGCLCHFSGMKRTPRATALNGKVFIYPQTDTHMGAVLHPALLNVLVSPPKRQVGSCRLRDWS